MIDISAYNKFFDNNDYFILPRITTIVPSPTENDYKVGYIQRYFIQKRADESAIIYEVEKYLYSENF